MRKNLLGLILLLCLVAAFNAYHRPLDWAGLSVEDSGRKLVCRGRTILQAGGGLSKSDVIAVLGQPDDLGSALVYRWTHGELYVRVNPHDEERVTGFYRWGPRPSVLARGPFYVDNLPIQENLWRAAALKLKPKLIGRNPEGIEVTQCGAATLSIQDGRIWAVSNRVRLPNGDTFQYGDQLDLFALSLRGCEMKVDSYVPGCLLRCSSPEKGGQVAKLEAACLSRDGKIRRFYGFLEHADSPNLRW
jgi:hypothetical protein